MPRMDIATTEAKKIDGPDRGSEFQEAGPSRSRERPATHTRMPDANLQGKTLYNGDIVTGTHPRLC